MKSKLIPYTVNLVLQYSHESGEFFIYQKDDKSKQEYLCEHSFAYVTGLRPGQIDDLEEVDAVLTIMLKEKAHERQNPN